MGNLSDPTIRAASARKRGSISHGLRWSTFDVTCAFGSFIVQNQLTTSPKARAVRSA